MDEGRDELVAVLGIPHGVAYAIDDEQHDLADAPGAVRAANQAFVGKLDHYDFDLGGALLDGRPLRVVDGGDVASRSAMVATTPSARGAHCERSSRLVTSTV